MWKVQTLQQWVSSNCSTAWKAFIVSIPYCKGSLHHFFHWLHVEIICLGGIIHIILVYSYTCLWRGTIWLNYWPLLHFILNPLEAGPEIRPVGKNRMVPKTTASICSPCFRVSGMQGAECSALSCACCRRSWETHQRKVSAGCIFQVKVWSKCKCTVKTITEVWREYL